MHLRWHHQSLVCPQLVNMSDSSDIESSKKGKSKSSLKWGEKLRFLSPLSKPLASRKETKHILKLVKKGTPICHVSHAKMRVYQMFTEQRKYDLFTTS